MKFLIIISLLFSSSAFAVCACERVSLSLGLSSNKNVFQAKIISVSAQEITLQKVTVFKGDFQEKIKLGTSSCAPQFKVGDENVFYVNEAKIETECDHFFSVSDKGMYQHFLKLKAETIPSKK